MWKNRPLTLVTAALVLVVALLVATTPLEAICGDCAVILNEPTCVSPPPNFLFCSVKQGYQWVVVMGTLIRVEGPVCETSVSCAV